MSSVFISAETPAVTGWAEVETRMLGKAPTVRASSGSIKRAIALFTD